MLRPASLGEAQPERASGARGPGPLQPGQLLAERYRVEAQVGVGVGAFVYRAQDLVSGVPVALKVLHPQPWTRARPPDQLYRELRFGRSIHHPNICRVHDVFEAAGRCLLVMEYASGGNLRGSLGPAADARPLAERLADARAIVAGLAAIHQAGLVHRDIKPENVLRLADGRLVISDFGLMRALEQATATTGGLGTPGYLAPEILAGGRAEQASDVWSLGVLLHELVTGQRPGADRSRRLPRALARVVSACLQVDLRRRPRTASAVEALLESGARSRWTGRRARMIAAVALLAAAPAALWLRRADRPRPAPPPSLGEDWSRARVLYTASPRSDVTCWQVVPPDGRIVRVADITETLVYDTLPPRVFDIDVQTSRQQKASTPGERYLSGCPQLSPDGRALLFPRRIGGVTHVMYAPRPDGADAQPLVAGSHPSWAPSGRSFLFVTSDDRIAMSDLDGQTTPLERVGPAPERVGDIAVDAAGDRAAVRVRVGGEGAGPWLELYDLRSRKEVGRWRLEGNVGAEVRFDARRGAFQVPTVAGAEAIVVELSRAGQLVPRGHLGDASIHALGPAAGGVVMSALARGGRRVFVVSPDGSAQQVAQGSVGGSNLGAGGEMLLSRPVAGADAPMRRLFLWRPGAGERFLTEDRVGMANLSLDATVAVYHHREQGETFACDLRSASANPPCRLVHADPQMHDPPGPGPIGPDDDSYPYFALDPAGAGDVLVLKLLSLREGRARELVRLRTACPVVWGWEQTLWTLGEGESHWQQRDGSGRPTGKTWPAAPKNRCLSKLPPGPRTAYSGWRESGWDLRYLPDPVPAAAPPGP